MKRKNKKTKNLKHNLGMHNENIGINFIDFCRDVEIKELNKRDEYNTLSSHFKEKYSNLKIPSFLFQEFSDLEKNYLEELSTILSFFSHDNMYYNKVWKYKVLYFLYGGFIYMQEAFLREHIITKKDKISFFTNEKQVKWYAFANGPITNHYHYGKTDDIIYLNFASFFPKLQEALEKIYIFIKNSGSIEYLIQKSHETPPWRDSFENKKSWQEISKDRITNYFKDNPPFFMHY